MLTCRHDADMFTRSCIVLSLPKCAHVDWKWNISRKYYIVLAYYGSCRLLVMGSWNIQSFQPAWDRHFQHFFQLLFTLVIVRNTSRAHACIRSEKFVLETPTRIAMFENLKCWESNLGQYYT